MKQTTTLLFLLIYSCIYGQKWHLNGIDKSSKFKYEYWFQFENADDSSTYSFKKFEGTAISTIQLTDNKGDTVIFAPIKIKNLDNDTTVKILTDINGIGKLQLKPGKYTMLIPTLNYDTFSFDFSIIENEFLKLNVKLGLAPELEVYQINSKTQLTETEILTILKCVKENRQEFYKNCSDQKKFYISMHI